MQTFATLIAFACLFWSVLSFVVAVVQAFARNERRADVGEYTSIGWMVAAGVFFIAAAPPG